MASSTDTLRRVRSFVRREGRMTRAQKRALEEHWPRYGLNYSPELIDFHAVFGRDAERVLEIGFGNGDALFDAAISDPARDFIGIEVYRPGAGALLRRAAEAGIENLRVSMHDAVEVLEHQLPPTSLAEVRLFFPDPWPKKRHHKRRIVQPEFVQLVAARLVPGGVFHLATDWEEYADWMLVQLQACGLLDNTSPDGGFVPRPARRPATRFEERGLREGNAARDLVFTRVVPY